MRCPPREFSLKGLLCDIADLISYLDELNVPDIDITCVPLRAQMEQLGFNLQGEGAGLFVATMLRV